MVLVIRVIRKICICMCMICLIHVLRAICLVLVSTEKQMTCCTGVERFKLRCDSVVRVELVVRVIRVILIVLVSMEKHVTHSTGLGRERLTVRVVFARSKI